MFTVTERRVGSRACARSVTPVCSLWRDGLTLDVQTRRDGKFDVNFLEMDDRPPRCGSRLSVRPTCGAYR